MSEVNLGSLGFNPALLEQIKKKPEDINKFDSLDQAVEFANGHKGDETILQTKDDSGKDVFIVVNLKAGAKASDIFDPNNAMKFPTAIITRGNNKLEIVSDKTNTDDETLVKNASALGQIAASDSVKGFKWNETGKIEGASAYQVNLKSALGKIDQANTILTTKKTNLEGELKVLIEAKPQDPDKIKAKQKEISVVDTKLEELKTQKGIINIKLSVQPKSSEKIPGTELKIGAYRSTPAQAITALQARIDILEKKLATEKENGNDPDRIKSLEGQIAKLNSEITFVGTASGQISQAAIKTNLRVGALASMNGSLDTAKAELDSKVKELREKEQELKDNPSEALKKYPDIEKDIATLKQDVNIIRLTLIHKLNDDIAVFEKNIPGQNNDAGKKAVKLLKDQVKLLESLNGNDGEKVIEAVKDTHKKLLAEVVEGAKKFQGIEPKEAEMIGQIVEKTHEFVTTYKATQKLIKNIMVDVEKARLLPVFTYVSPPQPTLNGAQSWTPGSKGLTGIEANKVINDTYHVLNKDFNSYLGDPPIPNWMTFGKFASREAGTQIKSLEGAMEAIKTLTRIDGAIGNDTRAINELVNVMNQSKMIEQGIRMGAASMGIPNASSISSSDLIIAMAKVMGKAAAPFLPSDPVGAASAALAAAAPIMTNLTTLHGALVKGNTRIYENIVPAFDVFMKAEASGGDGLKALEAAGYGKPNKTPMDTYVSASNKDPQGFVMDAFKLYKESKNLADQIKLKENEGAPKAEIDALKKKREDVTHRANLLIGCQEQMAILQAPDIFNDKDVSKLLGAMTGTMSLTDSVGQGSLLPTSGGNHKPSENWADFKTRMGLDEVPKGTKGAIAVQDPAGKTHYFVPIDKPSSGPDAGDGTISRYFKDRLSGPDAKTIIDGKPRPMETDYLDNVQGVATITDYVPDGSEAIKLVPGVVELAPKAYHAIFD